MFVDADVDIDRDEDELAAAAAVAVVVVAVSDATIDEDVFVQTNSFYLYCKRANRYTPSLCCRNGMPHSVMEIISSSVY